MIDIESILINGINKGASDIHIVENSKPIFRINRILTEMNEVPELTRKDVLDIFEFFTNGNEGLRNEFMQDRRLDLNFDIVGVRRRVNIFLFSV